MAIYSRASQCGMKRTYTKAEAKRAAKRIGGGVEPYPCYHCKHYHVGHPPPKR